MRHGLFHAPPLIFVILLASACGGGGGGGSLASAPPPIAVAPAPAPSPAPVPPATTPSPAPVPAATTYTQSGGVDAAVSLPVSPVEFLPAHAAISHADRASGDLGQAVIYPASGPQISVGRDSAGGYVVELPLIEFFTAFDGEVVGEAIVQFGANTRYAASDRSSFYAARASVQSGNKQGDNLLAVERLQLTYTNVGFIEFCRNAAASECRQASDKQYAALVFGPNTPPGEIPLAGSASYAGDVVARNALGDTYVTGKAELGVNFASSSVAGNLTGMTGRFDDALTSGVFFSLPDYQVSGTLRPSGQLGGSLTPVANGDGWVVGQWSGSFYGPNAAEIGAALTLPKSGVSEPLIGTLVAARRGP